MNCSSSLVLPSTLEALRYALREAAWPLRTGPLLPPDSGDGSPPQALDLMPGSPTPFWWVEQPLGADLARHCVRVARAAPGRSALLVAPGPGGLRFAVCAWVDRGAFVWQPSPGGPKRLDAEAWSALRSAGAPSVAALRLAAVLERRDVDARFFRDVRQWRDALREGWQGLPNDDHERAAQLAMLTIARMVFLAFVQRKGWLDNDPKFLARLLLEPGATKLYRERLRPLWFDALNRTPDERGSGPRFAGVPFLNGGLFEPSEVERRYPNLDLPDAALRDGFVTVIEGYRFVEDERRLEGAAIDPIMLGKVFEGLMADAQRAKTGTFYTPPELVDDVAARTLHAWLARRTTPALADAVAATGPIDPALAAEARGVLRGVRVLDPAAGSGAFLLGAMEWLVRARVRVEGPTAEDPQQLASRIRRDVLGRSLFGVDISPIAVLICELRLWLSLAASLPDRAPPPPLPNLHHRIRVGNALHGMPDAYASPDLQKARTELRVCCDALADATGAAKRDLDATRRALEREIAAGVLEAALEREVGRASTAVVTPLFPALEPLPARTGHRAGDSRRIEELEGLLVATLSEQWAPVFDAAVQFPEAASGFDVIVGNPPWVRMTALPAYERDRLRQRFRWMQASANQAFGAQPDLCVAFVERAAELLSDRGVMGLVVPNKLFTAQYGTAMRRGLIRDLSLVAIDDLHAQGQQPFDVQVYPGVLIAANAPCPPAASVRVHAATVFDADARALASGADPGGSWLLVPTAERERARRWTEAHPALHERFALRMGIKTGANALFVDPPDEVAPVLPVLRGRDVRAWDARPSATLWFAHDVETAAVLPSVSSSSEAYAAANAEALARRCDWRPGDPLWTVFRASTASLGHRVVWRDIGLTLEAASLPPVAAGGPLVLNTVYLLDAGSAEAALALTAWLNTTPIRWLAGLTAEPALNGFRRYQARNVGALPLPETVIDASGEPSPDWLRLARAAAFRTASEQARAKADAALDAMAQRALDTPAITPWLRWQ